MVREVQRPPDLLELAVQLACAEKEQRATVAQVHSEQLLHRCELLGEQLRNGATVLRGHCTVARSEQLADTQTRKTDSEAQAGTAARHVLFLRRAPDAPWIARS